MVYDPFRRDWRLSSDTGVDYLFVARKTEGLQFRGAIVLSEDCFWRRASTHLGKDRECLP